MLRHEPITERRSTVSDTELGIAVVLLGLVLILAVIVVPLVG
ncbi:MAG: hypothetical protein ABI622_00500 [Chloroflexota bacterium]